MYLEVSNNLLPFEKVSPLCGGQAIQSKSLFVPKSERHNYLFNPNSPSYMSVTGSQEDKDSKDIIGVSKISTKQVVNDFIYECLQTASKNNFECSNLMLRKG